MTSALVGGLSSLDFFIAYYPEVFWPLCATGLGTLADGTRIANPVVPPLCRPLKMGANGVHFREKFMHPVESYLQSFQALMPIPTNPLFGTIFIY